MQWWNPAASPFRVIEGQGWQEAGQPPYDRFPPRAQQGMNPNVWNLSHNSAGLYIKFRSDAPDIVVRYVVQGKGNFAFPHMPATGVSGVDLYSLSLDGAWQWAPGHYAFGDTIEYRFPHLQADPNFKNRAVEYRLYLPLYNTVNWMEIGVASGKQFAPMPLSAEKPIVVYGTSIAQGACATRPGLAWPAILNRHFDRPLLNLGFSGNGLLEPHVLSLLAEQDAKIYVLDCMPNLSLPQFSNDTVAARIVTAVEMLQARHPGVPILFVEHGGDLPGNLMDTTRINEYTKVNRVLRKTFAQLIASGKKGLYLLSDKEIGFDIESTVDGIHPNDAGMLQQARAYEKVIRKILNESSGSISTTIPVVQSRDGFYDWRARHQEQLLMNKTHPPRNLIMGNSIIHFWGGEPKAPQPRGAAAWEQYLAPLGVRNMGYGWDRIENVLWRVQHDELDGFDAQHVLLMIGTNNLEGNTDDEIMTGLENLVQAVKQRQPKAGVIISGILPRRNMEPRVAALNKRIAAMAAKQQIRYINPGTVFLGKNGKIDETLFSDGLHPVAAGYEKLGKELQAALK
ncbi:SGNH/GDSL hydrolase family protein [Chitinophaga vietnamensis]|nr:SGNH/GDSL hydrolase family protein [Chitinophaga vietnamensis]